MKSSREIKIILLLAMLFLGLFSLLVFAIRNYLLPMLPANLQTFAIQFGGALVLTVALMASFAQITGYSLRDFSFHKRVEHSTIDTSKSKQAEQKLTQIDGTHKAKGDGEITALDIQGPVIIKPGTKSIAEGSGKVTATRISNERKDQE